MSGRVDSRRWRTPLVAARRTADGRVGVHPERADGGELRTPGFTNDHGSHPNTRRAGKRAAG
jgi:hypothetical protein